ncbi:hypothetical protein [Bradyrhizobium sp. DOA9]|uniref:hypothetical protein n=1 Tax=Bradyrhizobium sp. DOA9 TaxID=1126627 RepID=UPI000A8ED9CA|nr:hypothetical protein [Bradyrhizobium sp. DOA9]
MISLLCNTSARAISALVNDPKAIVRALRLEDIAEVSRLAAQKRVTSAAQSIIIMIAS